MSAAILSLAVCVSDVMNKAKQVWQVLLLHHEPTFFPLFAGKEQTILATQPEELNFKAKKYLLHEH